MGLCQLGIQDNYMYEVTRGLNVCYYKLVIAMDGLLCENLGRVHLGGIGIAVCAGISFNERTLDMAGLGF